MAKRGPKPKHRPIRDEGSPELILKRLTISPSDATMSTCPLDVMLTRGIIVPEAHAAVAYFLGLRKLMFGKAQPGAIDLLAVSGRSADLLDDKEMAKVERKYRDACSSIQRFGGRTLSVFEDVMVHGRWPEWIAIPKSTHWERRLVLLGVSALLGWHQEAKRIDQAEKKLDSHRQHETV